MPNKATFDKQIDASNVTLTRVDDGTEVPVKVSESGSGIHDYIVKPKGSFERDVTFDFTGDVFCDWDGDVEASDTYQTTFSTTVSTLELFSIGTLRISESGYGRMSPGGCNPIEAKADQRALTLDLNTSARSWSDGLFYQVQTREADSEDWRDGRRKPQLRDPDFRGLPGPSSSVVDPPFRGAFIYKMCEIGGEPVSESVKEEVDVRMKVEHPPTGQTWTTNSVQVTLECPDQGGDEVGVDAGADTGPDAGKDAGQDDQDAGSDTGGDLGPDAGPPRFDDVITDEVGCGCSTGNSRVPVGAPLMFAVGLLGLVRRSRS